MLKQTEGFLQIFKRGFRSQLTVEAHHQPKNIVQSMEEFRAATSSNYAPVGKEIKSGFKKNSN
jgi:hypothetical protein